MTSEIKADKWSPASGTSATIGDSGDTYTIPSGVTFTNNGTATGFGVSLANGVDNRIVTSSSATALNGESELTFDGTLNIINNDPNIKMTDTNTDSYSQLTNANGTITIEADKGAGSGSSEIRFTVDNTQRASIDSTGALKTNNRLIIDNDANSSYKINLEYGGNAESGAYMNDKDGANNATYFNFRRGGTEIGSIMRNGTNDSINFNTSSDYRLKQSEENITDGITRIKQLKPYKFNWKSNPSGNKVDGFFAHEVQLIIPEAVNGEKDGMTPEVLYTADDPETQGDTPSKNVGDVKEVTKIQPQGIDQSKLVPLLTSALQEAITKIETLETKVAALESA